MTPRERVEAAFRFEEPDALPYTIWYDESVGERIAAHYGDADWAKRFPDHILRLAVEWEEKTPAGPDRYVDEHGTEWRTGQVLHIARPALDRPSLEGYAFPDAAARVAAASGEVREQFERAPEVFRVVGYGFGLFERGWMLRGFEDFFMDLVENQDFVDEILDAILDQQLGIVDELAALPVDGIIFSDDYGDQRGVIIGPVLWRRFVKPRLARLYGRAHEHGKFTLQHTCGNVFDIIPDLIEAGLDCLQCLQPEAMDVYEIKRRYGNRLRLWGGVGTQQLLPRATPAEVRQEVLRLARELGRGGGYVLTTAKPLRPDVPTENAIAFLEALAELHG